MIALAEVFNPSGSVNTDPAHDAPTIVGGIDCSPRRVGYCFMYQETEQVLISGTKHINRGDDLRNRYVAWGRILAEYERTGARKHQITAVGIEDAYIKFPRVAIQTAMSIGNMEAFVLQAVPWALIDLIPAATWRSTLGISGKGKEAPRLHALTLKAPIDVQDEADAICIAQATARRIVSF